jgi:hypothetical protein
MSESGRTLPVGGAFLIEPVTAREPFIYEDFTPEELSLAATAEGFVTREVLPHLDDVERQKPGLMPGLLKRAGELGLLMLEIPTEYGGMGLGKAPALLVAAHATESASFSVSLNAHTGIGTLPLVFYGDEARTALADGDAPSVDHGPLTREVAALQAAKRLTAHVTGLLLERHVAELAHKQQHLELLSDMICEVYAFDSAVARTLKLIRLRGVEGAVLEIDLTRVVAARCADALSSAARCLIANDAAPGELEERLGEISTLSPYVPTGILDVQTRIAERVTAMYAPSA